MRDICASMKLKVPIGLRALRVSIIWDAFSSDRPIINATGPLEYFTNCLNAPSPMPSVAPANTATRPGGRDCSDWLEIRTSFRFTIVSDNLDNRIVEKEIATEEG